MSTTIASNTSFTVNVKFAPTVTGARTGQLTFTSNAVGSPHSVALSGTGETSIPIDPTSISWLTADGTLIRDEDGNQVLLRSANWYGMEQSFTPGGCYQRGYKTVLYNGVEEEGQIDLMKRLGFNSIRILVSQDITWPGTNMNTPTGLGLLYCNPFLNPDFFNNPDNLPLWALTSQPQPMKTGIEILDLLIAYAKTLNMRVILDMHVLAPDNDNNLATNGKWYTTALPGDVGGTSSEMRTPRSEQQAIDAWVFYANRYKDEPTVCAFDIINEPWACTWDNDPLTGLPAYYERVGAAIQAVNPNVMIVCEGIQGNVDQTPVGAENTPEALQGAYLWGTIYSGKLDVVRARPVVLPIPNKVIYSPHEYGSYLNTPDIAHQWFHPQDINNYPGLPFPANMFEVWRREWGYLAEENIAPVWIGEYGSDFRTGGVDWGQNGVSSIFDPGFTQEFMDLDTQWIGQLQQYCNTFNIGHSWWSYNPGTVGGIVEIDWETILAFKYKFLFNTFLFPLDQTLDPTQLFDSTGSMLEDTDGNEIEV